MKPTYWERTPLNIVPGDIVASSATIATRPIIMLHETYVDGDYTISGPTTDASLAIVIKTGPSAILCLSDNGMVGWCFRAYVKKLVTQ